MRSHAALGTLISILYLASVATEVVAAPAPGPVTVSIQDGQLVTFSGTGFGTKSPAAPWKWDDFEAGTPGQTVSNGWNVYNAYGGQIPTYTTEQQRTPGSISTKQGPEGNSSLYATGFPGTGTAKLYISGWFYGTKTGNSRSNKFMNFDAGSWAHPEIRSGGDSWYWSDTVACDSGGTSPMRPTGIPDPYNTGQWHRWEWYVQLGSNGTFRTYRDGVLEAEVAGDYSFNGCGFSSIYMSSYWGQNDSPTPASYHSSYWDELYIDITPARVELGNSSTYSACTHREIQIPTAWSDGSVTVKINQGSFADGSTVYLYVIDRNGAVNQTGRAVTLGSGGGVAPLQVLAPVATGGTFNIPESMLVVEVSGTAYSAATISSITWSNSRNGESGTVDKVSDDWRTWMLNGVALLTGTNLITFEMRDSANQLSTASIVLNSPRDFPGAPGKPFP